MLYVTGEQAYPDGARSEFEWDERRGVEGGGSVGSVGANGGPVRRDMRSRSMSGTRSGAVIGTRDQQVKGMLL